MNNIKRSCFSIGPEFGRQTDIPARAVARARAAQPTNATIFVIATALATLTFWILWPA